MAETALVTGASSGIGEEFARQLADRGYELILVARRSDRLQKLAEELPTKATVIECDLASDAASLPGKVAGSAQVDLLVNNAGFGIRGPLRGRSRKARRRDGAASTARPSSSSRGRSCPRWSSAAAAASSPSPPRPACSRSPTRRPTPPARRSRSTSPRRCTGVAGHRRQGALREPRAGADRVAGGGGTPGGEMPSGVPGRIEAPRWSPRRSPHSIATGARCSPAPGSAGTCGPRSWPRPVKLRLAERMYRPD